MPVPPRIQALVQHFTAQNESYRSGQYNETQLRRDFLDPFFKELGWDVDNTQGYAETYREVVHEDRVRVGGQTKAPDYSFRIGGQRKFFVEAKKPAVVVRDEIDPALQVRRYGWNAKLPVSVLTDFEEFAIYDTQVKPNASDKASTARLFYCTFRDYEKPYTDGDGRTWEKHWDYISSIFSKEAILKGSFDRYVKKGTRKGTAEVDEEFLKDIEGWRMLLAKNLAKNNTLNQRELNTAVQTTIDRIIFLRICEDRGIEAYGQLQKASEKTGIYSRLLNMFKDADDRYNSGLFHFRTEKGREDAPDTLTPRLAIDDAPLKEIVKSLYYPSPYEFSVIPADILGSVYERFLGKVIRLTSEHRAVVEEKPEVRKAGGVYYTPAYIVDYIVENTVGELLKGKTPEEVSKLRILDPACGSGSFLIAAYQKLLDWHLDYYTRAFPLPQAGEGQGEGDFAQQKRAKTDGGRKPSDLPIIMYRQTTDDRGLTTAQYRLTTAERKRILLNNIYGVDIDSQAVEVTKLSLLLKVLEGETEETVTKNVQLFKERALPDLSRNIKCGNSLIGPDFYSQGELSLSDDEHLRINAFDWEREFREVFTHKCSHKHSSTCHPERSEGSPHLLSGDPSVASAFAKASADKSLHQDDKLILRKDNARNPLSREAGEDDFAKQNRVGAQHKIDDRRLTTDSGFDAVIGNPPWGADIARQERSFLLKRFNITEDTKLDSAEFFIMQMGKLARSGALCSFIIPSSILFYGGWANSRNFLLHNTIRNLVNVGLGFKEVNLESCIFVLEIGNKPKAANVVLGHFTPIKKYLPTKELKSVGHIEQRLMQNAGTLILSDVTGSTPNILGKIQTRGEFLANISREVFRGLYIPDSVKEEILDRGKYLYVNKVPDASRYSLDQIRKIDLPKFIDPKTAKISKLSRERIIVKVLRGNRLTATLAPADVLTTEKLVNVIINDKHFDQNYVLAVLNSSLVSFYLQKAIFSDVTETSRVMDDCYLKHAPVPKIPLSEQKKFVLLGEKAIALRTKKAMARTPQEQTVIERQITATDDQIDQLVYELYGLNEDEIKIVEGA